MAGKMREMEFCACLRNASDIKFGFEKIFLKELWLQCEVFSGNYKPRSGDDESFCSQDAL